MQTRITPNRDNFEAVDDTISTVGIWNSQKLNTMKECLQNRLLWFDHHMKKAESSWPSKFQKFECRGSWLEEDQLKYATMRRKKKNESN